ncbi:MAG: hypothetical protein R8P61_36480 [Bacteroidia bacterium]|nr:hypothetical protein [Bacteroidia bacterium]
MSKFPNYSHANTSICPEWLIVRDEQKETAYCPLWIGKKSLYDEIKALFDRKISINSKSLLTLPDFFGE